MSISKHVKRLASLAVVAMVATAMTVSIAGAQSPPNPPSRFVGNIAVDGIPVAGGTLVEARIGNATCGATTTFMSGSEARYVLDSPAIDPSLNPSCGVDGSTVEFYVAGKKAAQTGSWANYKLNTVNLTVATAATPPPTAVPSKTPAAPVAGNSGGESNSPVSMTDIMLVAAAFGLGGVAIASKARKS